MPGREGIAHLLLGNNTAHVTATAQANQLALALRLNEEAVRKPYLALRMAYTVFDQSYDDLGRSLAVERIFRANTE